MITNEKKLQLTETEKEESEPLSKDFVNVEVKSVLSKNESKSSEGDSSLPETNLSNKRLLELDPIVSKTNTNSSRASKNSKKNENFENDSKYSESNDGIEENGSSMEASEEILATEASPPEESSFPSSILIGEAVVSVVTTKSVVNGTISVPVTSSPLITEQISTPPISSTSTLFSVQTSSLESAEDSNQVTTEDSSRILASVQTSRSISGARFLPFPVIDRIEQLDQSNEETTSKKSSSLESTESIIDKLDRVQSELTNGFLAGGFRTSGNTLQVDSLPEGERPNQKRYTTTIKPPGKFVPRRYSDRRISTTSTTLATTVSTTTVKPTTFKTSTSRFRLQTTLDDLEGLLPKNYPKSSLRRQFSKSTTVTTPVATEATTRRSTTTATTVKNALIVENISAFLPPGIFKFEY